MACILHGLARSASVPNQVGKSKLSDFFGPEVPAFMLGKGTGIPRGGLGPGAMFSTYDPGDETANLSQLERRLYHQVPPRKEQASPPKPKTEKPPLTSLSLAGCTSSSAQGVLGQNPLPYPASEASSRGSKWHQKFLSEAPPGLFARGLLANDISRATEKSAGVCVLRPMSLPPVAPFEASDMAMRLHATKKNLRRRVKEHAAASRAFQEGPSSPGGSSRGSQGEMLPKQQRLTIGRPSLCRKLPGDINSDERRTRYALANDSYFASEHRVNFWWKGISDDLTKEIKAHVRPQDSWTHFRDNAFKARATMRHPINSF